MRRTNIIDKWALRRVQKAINAVPDKLSLSDINEFFGNMKYSDHGPDISEITYYTCLKVLSESLGKLSLHLKDGASKRVTDHEAIRVLKRKPNVFMSASTFRTLMEYRRNHYGNAYAYLDRKGNGDLRGVFPLDPSYVKVWIDDADVFKGEAVLFYEYTHPKTHKVYRIHAEDMLHLKGGLSENGIVGVCVRETLAKNLEGSKASQSYMNELYKRGLTANAIIKYTGDFDSAKKKALVEELKSFSGDVDGERIIPIPLGMDLVPIDLKLTDSQFYELKKFTSLQIAAAFGVKPNHLNNYDKSSYANSEMQNLTFYVDTLLYILTQWEEELDKKLLTDEQLAEGWGFEFNIAKILRGDLKTQAEALTKFVQGSVVMVNEARTKAGYPEIPGGDVLLVNGTYVKLEDVGKAYEERAREPTKTEKEEEEDAGLATNQKSVRG